MAGQVEATCEKSRKLLTEDGYAFDVQGWSSRNKHFVQQLSDENSEFDINRELLQKQLHAILEKVKQQNKVLNAISDFSRRHKDIVWESSSFEEYSFRYEVSGLTEKRLVLPNVENSFEEVRKCCEPENKTGVIHCPYMPIQVGPLTKSFTLFAPTARTKYSKCFSAGGFKPC